MEGFTLVDIFATKGIEYLLVIGYLTTFIGLVMLLRSPARAVARARGGGLSAVREWFRNPEGIYYHQGHTWLIPEGNDEVKVGIDDFAQKLLGKIESIAVTGVGRALHQGEKAWTLTADSRPIDMLSPVSGEVIEINRELFSSPGQINQDPYGSKAWLIKVRTPRLGADLRGLLSGKLAQRWMEGVSEQLLAKMESKLGAVSFDGGTPVEGMAKNMDPHHWEKMVKEFFLTAES